MEVELERRGAVQILRINRPEARNALNPAVLAGIGGGVTDADRDPEVRAIVITGTGDRAFCAGMDLRAMAEGNREGNRGSAAVAAYSDFIRRGISKPVVGAANATAVAGGFELLLACDMIVASAEARFGLPEVKRGLFPAGGGVRLSRLIPLATALELGLTGDTIEAERAYQLGLVNRVVPPERVLDEAVALAEAVAANGPLGIAATKRLMRAAVELPDAELWPLHDSLQPEVFNSADAREGAQAFFERRPPRWTGK